MADPQPAPMAEDEFSSVDWQFAELMASLAGAAREAVFYGAALARRSVDQGEVCTPLDRMSGLTVSPVGGYPLPGGRLPDTRSWRDALLSSGVTGRPGSIAPLILDDCNRLYLFRYWQYEQRLAHRLRQRIRSGPLPVDRGKLAVLLNQFFPPAEPEGGTDWQRVAAVLAAIRPLCVVTGGPGTGKTHTAAMIIAVLSALHETKGLRIHLAAPTGKAAQRLKTSIQVIGNRPSIPPAIHQRLPKESYTIHRLLQPIADPPFFRYHRERPLHTDMVIVDEASMVDLVLMSRLVDAVPDTARLVLIGDRHQLASVEAGSVFLDIGNLVQASGFSTPVATVIRDITGETDIPTRPDRMSSDAGLQDTLVILKRRYRFEDDGGLHRFSQCVNRGDVAGAREVLENSDCPSVRWVDGGGGDHQARTILEKFIAQGYTDYGRFDNPAEARRRFDRFRILCVVREGPLGVKACNHRTERILMRSGRLAADARRRGPWYIGRPVMVIRNDYELSLFNGDTGIALAAGDDGGNTIRVFFPGDEGCLMPVDPDRLPPHETAFASTVHKSQGSEFDDVLLVLPDRDSPLVTRELIYTAVTRARKRVTIYGRMRVLQAGLQRRIDRASGLGELLRQPSISQ